MYYPILRGKQFELIALRELAENLAPNFICPVIEPVRGNLGPLRKTIDTLSSYGIQPVVIINPCIGDFAKLEANLLDIALEQNSFIPCVKAKSAADLSILKGGQLTIDKCAIFIENSIDKAFIEEISQASRVFVNKDKIHPGALSRLNNVVLFGDFFDKKTRNADYQTESFYSSLHTEWKSFSNAIGFGDYTILSEEYSESGGPAYVVTIHLSYINPDEFDAMYVRHFSSFNDDSPANPGGKFKSALEKVFEYIEKNPESFTETLGLRELLDLRGSPFPGLGQVKKYSMKHHIETTCNFVRGQHA